MRHHRTPAFACLVASMMASLPPAECQVNTGSQTGIFAPGTAPEIIIHVGLPRRLASVIRHTDVGTVLDHQSIEATNSTTISDLVKKTIAGAVSNASGEFHIRGSHGQYTYYLDGAPLPASVSGSFTDLIDPKNIEFLQVYTGGFPAKYGDNLAAVFDVVAKAGDPGPPHGEVQQIAQRYRTFETTGQVSGGTDRFTYFLSGVHSSSDRKLDPSSPEPLHDAGSDSVVFGKFDLKLNTTDKLVLDTAHSDSLFQLPNAPDRQALGQDDVQRENSTFGNLIWRHDTLSNTGTVAFYSHTSRLRYSGSPADLIGATVANPLASASEDRTSTYFGLRTDFTHRINAFHKLGYGFDFNTLVGNESFGLSTTDGTSPPVVINDQHKISGGDRSEYIQDDYKSNRTKINYGVRYDVHKADTETSQVSPRINVVYDATGRDRFHAYYDRLFQPAPIEDVRKLDPNAVSFKPERDNFYEIGYERHQHRYSEGLAAYYKTAQDVIDDNLLTGTRILEPFNVQKGYVRGIEFSADGPLQTFTSYYLNYARSWARADGDFTGGLLPQGPPPGYFYDDHDQTQTASMGVSFNDKTSIIDLNAEYGSGLPYGQDAAGNVNILRVDPHFIINLIVGHKHRNLNVDLTVDNLLNHPYVIKEASPFTDLEYGEGRSVGFKITQTF